MLHEPLTLRTFECEEETMIEMFRCKQLCGFTIKPIIDKKLMQHRNAFLDTTIIQNMIAHKILKCCTCCFQPVTTIASIQQQRNNCKYNKEIEAWIRKPVRLVIQTGTYWTIPTGIYGTGPTKKRDADQAIFAWSDPEEGLQSRINTQDIKR